MKKFLLILLFGFPLLLSAQRYQYKIQMNNPGDEIVKSIMVRLNEIYDVQPVYIDSTNTFYVKSSLDITQATFSAKMSEYGFSVLLYNQMILISEENETVH